MTRVVVNIDRLLLRGFRHADRHAVAQGLREELARLLAEPDAGRRLACRGDVPKLAAGRVRVAPDAKHYEVGARAARGIAGGMLGIAGELTS